MSRAWMMAKKHLPQTTTLWCAPQKTTCRADAWSETIECTCLIRSELQRVKLAVERGYPDPRRWWDAIEAAGIDVQKQVHEKHELMDKLPWDHVNGKFGRAYLEKEQGRAEVQLAELAAAVGSKE